jgi:hypothetical protein
VRKRSRHPIVRRLPRSPHHRHARQLHQGIRLGIIRQPRTGYRDRHTRKTRPIHRMPPDGPERALPRRGFHAREEIQINGEDDRTAGRFQPGEIRQIKRAPPRRERSGRAGLHLEASIKLAERLRMKSGASRRRKFRRGDPVNALNRTRHERLDPVERLDAPLFAPSQHVFLPLSRRAHAAQAITNLLRPLGG